MAEKVRDSIIENIGDFFIFWSEKEKTSYRPADEVEFKSFLLSLSQKKKYPKNKKEFKCLLKAYIVKTQKQQEGFDTIFEEWASFVFVNDKNSNGFDNNGDNENLSWRRIAFFDIILVVGSVFGLISYLGWNPTKPTKPTTYSAFFKYDTASIPNKKIINLSLKGFDSVNDFEFTIQSSKHSLDSVKTLPFEHEALLKINKKHSINSQIHVTLQALPKTPIAIQDSIPIAQFYFSIPQGDSTVVTLVKNSFKINGKDNDNFSIRKFIIENKQASIFSQYWFYMLFAITSILFFLAFLENRKKIAEYLNRRKTKKNERFTLHDLYATAKSYKLSAPKDLSKNVSFIASQIESNQFEHDIEKTIQETIKNAGIVRLAWKPIIKEAIYVVLIDKKSFSDHQSDYAHAIISLLEVYGLKYHLYYFNADIRYCSEATTGDSVTLQDLQNYYSNGILLIFSELQLLDNSYYKRIQKDTKTLLADWNKKILFSIENLQQEHNKYAKFKEQYGFDIYNFSFYGLGVFIQQETQIKDSKLSHFLPTTIDNDITLLDRIPPEDEQVEKFLSELKIFLGRKGYLWLQALAVFPNIQMKLSLYLGHQLKDVNGFKLYHEEVFARLIQLPWLRYGYMPDWLREKLTNELSEINKEKIAFQIKLFFVDDKDAYGIPYTQYATAEKRPIQNIISDIFNEIIKKPNKADEVLKDRIFTKLVGNQLSVHLPNKLSKYQTVSKYLNFSQPSSFGRLWLYIKISFGLLLLYFSAFFIVPLLLYVIYLLSQSYRSKELVSQLFKENDPIPNVRKQEPKQKWFSYWREQPKGLYVLFFTEMWERFSYYGMRGILILYLIRRETGDNPGLGWTKGEALNLYGWYIMLLYMASIPGGWIADKFIGQKKSVLYGGILLCFGHGILAVEQLWAFYISLAIIVAGTGMLKPNISTMVGGLYKQGDIRRDKGFTIFYIGINVGAFLSTLIVGSIGEFYGWHYGFGLAGIGMLFSMGIYIWGQKYLTHVGNFIGSKEASLEEQAAMNTPLTQIEQDRVLALLVSLVLVIVFWGAFEQAGGLMNIYAHDKTYRMLMGIEVPVSWFQNLNALFIFLLGTTVAVFWAKRKLNGKLSTSLFKMVLGIIIMGSGFFFMAAAASEYENTGSSSMIWLVLAYLLHTIGELCISPVALSFITKLSPLKYASTMMGLFFAMTGLGNKLAGLLGESVSTIDEFTIFTGIAIFCMIFGGIVLLFRKKLEVLTHGLDD